MGGLWETMNAGSASRHKRTAAWKRLVGPDASAAENVGTLGGALIGSVLGWRASQGRVSRRTAATLLCADLVGGAWANNTCTTRAWYHRPGTSNADRLGFTAVHIHPFVAAWLWDIPRPLAAAAYVYALASAGLVSAFPPRRQLAVGWVLTVLGAAVGAIRFSNGHQPRWLFAVYYIKLIAGHSVSPMTCEAGEARTQ
jgi:hypothetical protein